MISMYHCQEDPLMLKTCLTSDGIFGSFLARRGWRRVSIFASLSERPFSDCLVGLQGVQLVSLVIFYSNCNICLTMLVFSDNAEISVCNFQLETQVLIVEINLVLKDVKADGVGHWFPGGGGLTAIRGFCSIACMEAYTCIQKPKPA